MKHTNAEVQNLIDEVKIKEHQSARFFNWLSTMFAVFMLCIGYMVDGTGNSEAKQFVDWFVGLAIFIWMVIQMLETISMIRLLRED